MSDEKRDQDAVDDVHHAGGCCNACAFSAVAEASTDSTSPPLQLSPQNGAQLVIKNVRTGDARVVDVDSVIVDGAVGFGRAPGAVYLDDPKVSRRHGSFIFDNEGVVVVDHGSGCGTYVNGKTVKRARLKVGDKVYLGDTVLQLRV